MCRASYNFNVNTFVTNKTISHSSVDFAKLSLLSKIKKTSRRLLDGGYNYSVRKIWRFACGFAGFQGTKMCDQLSNCMSVLKIMFGSFFTFVYIFPDFFYFFRSPILNF